MIPILAATTAINTIDKVATGAASAWKHLTAGGHIAGGAAEPGAAGSFAASLAAEIAKP
jgi:hypothetical protein